MKKLGLLLIVTLITGKLFAQIPTTTTRAQTVPPPLPTRIVSGVVQDSTTTTLIGATVFLKSDKDSLVTVTNNDGVFVFRDVKRASFTLTISSIGYRGLVKKMKNNDAVKNLVLDPITLKTSSQMLAGVVINGKPSVVYKTDTVEYKASDYKVRDNATIDELLKKMEGMEVGSDGTLTHQGTQVMKAKLNGKDYAGGDVAQAIQNLPADIVEKIQIVDDYGDQAARTGIKDGDPTKVLNITTRADRSVGNTARLTGQYGNDDRFNGQLFAQRINANQQIGIIARAANTVNGVASSGLAGGATNGGGGGQGVGAGAVGSSSPGTTKSFAPSFNYRDNWGKKLQVIGSYAYRSNDNNSINDSYGTKGSSLGNDYFTDHNTKQTDSKNHNFNVEMDYTIDSANYLQVTPSFSYSSSNSVTSSVSNDVDDYSRLNPVTKLQESAFQHLLTNSLTNNSNTAPNYGAVVFYQHIFKKPRRNASVQFSITNSNSTANGDRNGDTKYYADSTLNLQVKDSISHVLTYKTSDNTTYRTSLTYVEPISKVSQFEFNGQMRTSVYDNKAIQDSILANGQIKQITRLDNIYNYSFTETRATFNYRYIGTKLNFSLGTTLVPTLLDGTKVNNSGDGGNVSSSRSDFRIIPVFRFSYAWRTTQRISFTYSGTNNEPAFQQIQPFTDRTDPNNIVVGNPDLKPTFTNSYNLLYNNYFPNSRFNISFNLNGTYYSDQTTTNTLLLPVPNGVDPATGKPLTKIINEIHYVNLDGSYAYVGRYNISKQLSDRRYNLSLNGNVTYGFNNSMSDNLPFHSTTWRFDERFGPRITPNDNIEINPYIGYDVSRSFSNLKNRQPTELKTTSLAVDGRMYFLKTNMVNYSVTKSYVAGLTGLTNTSPLVINAGFEKQLLKKKNLVFTLNVYDILHQNNFIQQTVDNYGGVTNTLSNTLSRYFLVGLRLNLQKWSGSPQRNGQQMRRRGDGSFIEN